MEFEEKFKDMESKISILRFKLHYELIDNLLKKTKVNEIMEMVNPIKMSGEYGNERRIMAYEIINSMNIKTYHHGDDYEYTSTEFSSLSLELQSKIADAEVRLKPKSTEEEDLVNWIAPIKSWWGLSAKRVCKNLLLVSYTTILSRPGKDDRDIDKQTFYNDKFIEVKNSPYRIESLITDIKESLDRTETVESVLDLGNSISRLKFSKERIISMVDFDKFEDFEFHEFSDGNRIYIKSYGKYHGIDIENRVVIFLYSLKVDVWVFTLEEEEKKKKRGLGFGKIDSVYDPYSFGSSSSDYCGACHSSPCMCSDPW